MLTLANRFVTAVEKIADALTMSATVQEHVCKCSPNLISMDTTKPVVATQEVVTNVVETAAGTVKETPAEETKRKRATKKEMEERKAAELAAQQATPEVTPEVPQEVEAKPVADSTNDDLFVFIRAQATGSPLSLDAAEALIKCVTDNKPPSVEMVRAYLAASCNSGALTKDRAMELIKMRGTKPGMTEQAIGALTVPTMDPVLYIALVFDIAREAGVQ